MSDLSDSGRIVLACILVLYAATLLLVGAIAGRKVSRPEDFLLAGRRVPLGLSILALLATWFGSSAMLGATRSAYEGGLSQTLLEPWACGLALILTGSLFAARLWRLKINTLADLFRRDYGPWAEWISCVLQVPTFFFWIGAQYLSMGALLESTLGLPIHVGMILGAVISLTILASGGMRAVTWTDSLMVVVALTGMLLLAVSATYQLGDGNCVRGVIESLQDVPAAHWHWLPSEKPVAVLAALGILLSGALGNIPGQDLQQRIQASASARVAQTSFLIAGVLYLMLGCIPVFLGLAARSRLEHLITPEMVADDQVLPIVASHFLSEPLEIFLVLGLLSLNLAAACGATLSQSTMLESNVLRGWWQSPSAEIPQGLAKQRACAAAVTLGSLLAAFGGESVMGLLEISLSSVLVSLVIPMLISLFGRPTNPFVGIAPMLVGPIAWGTRWMLETAIAPDARPGWTEWYFAVPAELQGLIAAGLAAWAAHRMLPHSRTSDHLDSAITRS